MFGKNQSPDVGKATQIKPGQVMPGAGRPRKLPELREMLDKIMGEEKDQTTAMEQLFAMLRHEAIAKRDKRAAELILRYAYGNGQTDLNVKFVDPSKTSAEVQKIVQDYGLLKR